MTVDIKKMPSKTTIIRTVILVVAFINAGLALFGKSPLPFDNEEITNVISYIFTAGAAIWTWWKNNSFTQKAIKADEENGLG